MYSEFPDDDQGGNDYSLDEDQGVGLQNVSFFSFLQYPAKDFFPKLFFGLKTFCNLILEAKSASFWMAPPSPTWTGQLKGMRSHLAAPQPSIGAKQ